MATTIPAIDLRMADLERLVDRTRHAPLTEDEHATLKAAIDTLGYVAQLPRTEGHDDRRCRRFARPLSAH
jgi:hypothetical protein